MTRAEFSPFQNNSEFPASHRSSLPHRKGRPSTRSAYGLLAWMTIAGGLLQADPAPTAAEDRMREMQAHAIAQDRAEWGHWGLDPKKYTGWKTHSNRLIPAYTFGISLADVAGRHS